jgi:hypothetical protein
MCVVRIDQRDVTDRAGQQRAGARGGVRPVHVLNISPKFPLLS